MQIDHFIHQHSLSFYEEDGRYICDGCRFNISGPAYGCRICDFDLHKSCAELPFQIWHRFHQQHPLFLRCIPETCSCDKCMDDTLGFTYDCDRCSFTLDYKCASIPDVIRRQDGKQKNESIDHFIHKHSLILYPSWEGSAVTCSGCQLHFSAGSRIYCCIECLFFLHDTCIVDIQQGMEHHFHSHYLTARAADSHVVCGACKIKFRGISFGCDSCLFDLHVACAKLEQLTLENRCPKEKQHHLYYFILDNDDHDLFPCNVCDDNCVGSFYRCVKCDLNLHFECLELPRRLKCRSHSHAPLTFMYPSEIREEEYYLKVCERCDEERDPKYSAYYCPDCKYVADIHCILSKEESVEVQEYMKPRLNIRKLDHYIHQHTMTLRKEEGVHCNGCSTIISGPGPAYGCRTCSFFLHGLCAELPFQISHPSHWQHPIFLRCLIEACQCSVCHDKWLGFTYHCGRCSFTLDLKCALPDVSFPILEDVLRKISTTQVECDERTVEELGEGKDNVSGLQESDDAEEQESSTEEQESDTEEQESDAEEPNRTELYETILDLRAEVDTLKTKVDAITIEMEALKAKLLNTSHQQS